MIYAVDSHQPLCSMFTVDYFPFGFFQRLYKRFQHFCFMLWTFLLYFVCTVILLYGFLFNFFVLFVLTHFKPCRPNGTFQKLFRFISQYPYGEACIKSLSNC